MIRSVDEREGTSHERRARASREKFDLDWGWSNVRNLGLLTYLSSKRTGRDAALVGAVLAQAEAVEQV